MSNVSELTLLAEGMPNASSIFGMGQAACVRVDDAIDTFANMRQRARAELADPTSVVAPSVLLLASLLLLFAGARVFRGAAALCAALFASGAVYSFMRMSAQRVTCDAMLVSAAGVGVLAGLAAGCVYKAGLFFVGAAALASLVHLVFATFPELHALGDQPTLADKSFAYWVLLLFSCIVGGLVLRYHDKAVLEVLTACVGGAGFAYALRHIAEALKGDAPRYVFTIVGVAFAVAGVLVQRQLRLQGCRRKRSERGTELVSSQP